MLFRKKIEPRCAYCAHASSAAPGMVICRKKGIMPETEQCFRFRYAPLRRVPPRRTSVDFTKYDDKDYSL